MKEYITTAIANKLSNSGQSNQNFDQENGGNTIIKLET